MNDAARRRSRRGRSTALVSSHRWAPAVRHLRRVDPQLRAIIDRIGPCRLEPHADRFGALIRSIVSQQISSKAARSINLKLIALGGDPHRPERQHGAKTRWLRRLEFLLLKELADHPVRPLGRSELQLPAA